jgi:hypothetical protein
MAQPEVTVKGTAFLGTLKFLKTQPRGEALLEKILGQLPPEHLKIFKRKIIAIGNYPYPLFIDIIRQADRLLGKGDFAVCKKMGVFSAKRDYESIYNLYKQSPRPEDLFRDANVIWRSYYENAGEMKAQDISQDHLEIRIVNFPNMDPAHCKLMEGWMAQALIESGGRWVEELREDRCNSRGDEFHSFVGKWRHTGQG